MRWFVPYHIRRRLVRAAEAIDRARGAWLTDSERLDAIAERPSRRAGGAPDPIEWPLVVVNVAGERVGEGR